MIVTLVNYISISIHKRVRRTYLDSWELKLILILFFWKFFYSKLSMMISAFSHVTNLIAKGIELSLTTVGNLQLITLAVCIHV